MQADDSKLADEGGSLPASPNADRRVEWAAVGILALLSALCCAPLMNEGWFTSHEGMRPIARALAAYHEVAAGDLYPRWVTTAYLGKGAPLFNFYPPAFSLLAAYAHALGVPLLLGLKLVIYLTFFVGSLGSYLWVRRHLGHFPALVGAILYLFAPYHFVDLYVRGATAELTSLAALPFLFLATDMAIDRPSIRALATLAAASAAVVLSHFLMALMIAPFAVAYAIGRVLRRSGGWVAVGRVAGGTALGASLSAFYWLPSISERHALSPERLQSQLSGYYSPLIHFVAPLQWLDPTWGFGESVPGPKDGMSFQVGLMLLASVTVTVALLRLLGRDGRSFVVLALGLGIVALLLTSSAARPLYVRVQPFSWVQFPWRYLGPMTLFLAAAGAGCVRVLGDRLRWVGPGSAALVATLAVALSAPQRAVERPVPVEDDAAIERAVAADPWVASFGNGDEYLPRDAPADGAATRPGGPNPWGLGVEIGSVRAGRTDVTFDVVAPHGDGVAVVPWHAFPGWKVSLDGHQWQLMPGPEGLLAFWVPQGRHVARVRFGTTPPRVAGWLLALAGIATLTALALRERSLSRTCQAV